MNILDTFIQYFIMFIEMIALFLAFCSPAIIIWLVIRHDIKQKIQRYESTTYFKQTRIPYQAVRNDAGLDGEYLIYENLQWIEDCGAKFLFNTYLPISNNRTTEIDVILITHYGIFVFESKNYSGWIFGDENSKKWCQCLKSRYSSQKEFFYNPIMQNKTHIKAVQKQIKRNDIAYHSIITFSNRCDLMEVPMGRNIIHRHEVSELVTQICESNVKCLNDKQIEQIYNLLYPYTQVSESIKQQHIEYVSEL